MPISWESAVLWTVKVTEGLSAERDVSQSAALCPSVMTELYVGSVSSTGAGVVMLR